MARQHISRLSRTNHSARRIMQPLVWARVPCITTEGWAHTLSVFCGYYDVRDTQILLLDWYVKISWRCVYVCVFSGANLHNLMFSGKCSHVRWRVFWLQMSGLTANQQFWSSVTRTEKHVHVWSGFWDSLLSAIVSHNSLNKKTVLAEYMCILKYKKITTKIAMNVEE